MLTLLVVVLLIAIPAGYLVISAFQSRDSGEDKERGAAATSLSYGWPSKVQQRIYDVPVPPRSSRIAFYEDNSWKKSVLFVQFRTSPERLDDFLGDIGSGTSELTDGRVTISGEQAAEVGWDLGESDHRYAGTTLEQPGAQPDLAVTVDRTHESRPQVYVVSTATF
ncbi:hypothetical protein HCC30_01615 [Streptomyces sp. HNM0574]|nr:hypothetical protein [Streptomyces sp. HNM0574]